MYVEPKNIDLLEVESRTVVIRFIFEKFSLISDLILFIQRIYFV